MSTQFTQFAEALAALCLEHKVQLATTGYDAIGVWPARPGDPPIHGGHLVDNTGPNPHGYSWRPQTKDWSKT